MAAMMVVLAPRSPRLVVRHGTKVVVAGGMAVTASSFLLMLTFGVDTPLWWVIAVTLVMAAGMAHVMAPATESIMGSLPKEKAGVGSAMNDTTRQVGGAIGIALLGSIVSSIFASKMGALLDGVLPPGRLARVKDSVGEALGVARASSAVGARVAEAARESFVSAMHVSFLVGFAIMATGTIIVLKWLPALASEPGVEHAAPGEIFAAGITGVDVLPGEALADLAEAREYEREHR
jgi:hypothetical protein